MTFQDSIISVTPPEAPNPAGATEPETLSKENSDPSPRKVLIETWGCQMNVADSEAMLQILKGEKFDLTSNESEADLIILNTCHIREKAKHKILSRLGVLNHLKKLRPEMTIAVAGCVAQAEGRKLLKEAPGIDILLGPSKIGDLPSLLRNQKATGKPSVSIGFKPKEAHSHALPDAPPPLLKRAPATLTGIDEVTRYLNIVQGCNNFCTFCVVPFTRGREVSRLPREILAEAQALLDTGAKELMLLGQNVNSYGQDLVADSDSTEKSSPFVSLLRGVAALPKLERLRFTTSNPHDFTHELASLFASEPKMGRYLHLPVQSGNNRILEVMRRKVTVAEYLERIRWLREIDPEMAVSTDLIVGFPGETDQEFEDTLKLMAQVRFSFSFAFKYSSRPNTAAARFKDQIPEAVKDQRLKKLITMQEKITMELQQEDLGKSRDVLFVYESKKSPGMYYGRTPQYRLVRVASSSDIVGMTIPILITGSCKTALEGSLLS